MPGAWEVVGSKGILPQPSGISRWPLLPFGQRRFDELRAGEEGGRWRRPPAFQPRRIRLQALLPFRSRRGGRCCRRVAKAGWLGLKQVLGVVRKAPPLLRAAAVPIVPSKTRRFLRIFVLTSRHFRHVDREVLVVVAVPFDAGVEEDFAETERQGEAEARRFALARHEVVDGDVADSAVRAGEPRTRSRRCSRLWMSAGQAESGEFAVRERSHWGVACGLTLSPCGRSTQHRLDVADRFAGARFWECLTMIWVKPTGRMAGRLGEELIRRVDAAVRRVRACRSPPASPLSAVSGLSSMMSTATRGRCGCQRQQNDRSRSPKPNTRALPHLKSPPVVSHLPIPTRF